MITGAPCSLRVTRRSQPSPIVSEARWRTPLFLMDAKKLQLGKKRATLLTPQHHLSGGCEWCMAWGEEKKEQEIWRMHAFGVCVATGS